ncbi:MAG: hypothetical protein ACK5Z2_04705 [Bacteroidota bacterium]
MNNLINISFNDISLTRKSQHLSIYLSQWSSYQLKSNLPKIININIQNSVLTPYIEGQNKSIINFSLGLEYDNLNVISAKEFNTLLFQSVLNALSIISNEKLDSIISILKDDFNKNNISIKPIIVYESKIVPNNYSKMQLEICGNLDGYFLNLKLIKSKNILIQKKILDLLPASVFLANRFIDHHYWVDNKIIIVEEFNEIEIECEIDTDKNAKVSFHPQENSIEELNEILNSFWVR